MAYTIEQARSAAAEVLAILQEETNRRQALIQEISALQQGIVTQAAVDAIEQKNTQARARYRALLEPATTRFITIANAGVGFFGRSELQQLNDTILAAFAVEDAATETARAALAQLKQSTGNTPGTASAGTEVEQGQTARDENANTQNPEAITATPTPAGTNATTTAGPTPPAVAPPPPKLPGTTGNVSPPDNTAPTTTLPGTPIPLAGRDLISVVGGSDAFQSYIYRAATVTHMFSKGMFTQQLEGYLVIYDIPPQSAPAAPDQSDAETARLNRQNAAAAVPDQSDAETARLNRQNAAANTANVNPNSVSTPQTPPPSAADTGQASVAPPPSTAAPETVAPAETAPPTSGSEDVSVPVNTTPPPTTIEFAGATLTASLQISGRVFIQLTLPSGATEINVDGWGDAQWDSLLSSTTNSADIAAINSLKASWSSLQSQLRQSVTAPAPVTNATPQNMAKEA
jgi:hypothetical protein